MKLMTMRIKQMVLLSVMAVLPLSVYASTPVSDDKIESNIKNSHMFKSYLKDDAVDVSAKSGVVTLSGTVALPSHKALAEDTAENMDGVKRVDDQIFVKGNGDQGSSDNWIEAKVKTALMFHRNVSGLKTEVSVRNGAVTLQGTADSAASRDLAAEYAKDIEGVTSVDNQIAVASSAADQTPTMSEKIDDASITAQVKAVLLYHRSTSALRTTVKTNDGTVMLGGTAHSTAEKDLVSKLVQDVNGVKDVKNNMTVTPTSNG